MSFAHLASSLQMKSSNCFGVVLAGDAGAPAVGLQREGGELQLQNPRIFSSAEHGFPAGLVGRLDLVVGVLATQERISLVVGA
jgi:hypothetical protein